MLRRAPARRALSCRAVGRALQAYLDDELTAERRPSISAHLAACPRCGRDAGSYLRLKARLARLATGPSAQGALDRLRAFADELA